ncbi:DNA adenine methylase, partial [Klebsiella pneumoniae]|nr:DNA adenine methylase [Klebsiella pneumoniae]
MEPFAGSCAVTLNTSYERYVVADINQDLINLYRMIREQPESIISLSRNLFSCCNSHDEYYRLRDVFNQRTS